MEKGKGSNKKFFYCIPFIIQLISHIAASFLNERGGDNVLLRVFTVVLLTVIYMLLGEGYGSIALIVAGFLNRIGAYVAVIIFSVISAGASFAGYMIKGMEGEQCLWMTSLFCLIDLFLIVFSINRISMLSSKGKTKT